MVGRRRVLELSILFPAFLAACSGSDAPSAPPTGRSASLDGTWRNEEMGWGLRFAGNRVMELEGDELQDRGGTFEVDGSGSPFRLIIREPGRDGTLVSLFEIDGDRLRMTPPSTAPPATMDAAGPVIVLERDGP